MFGGKEFAGETNSQNNTIEQKEQSLRLLKQRKRRPIATVRQVRQNKSLYFAFIIIS